LIAALEDRELRIDDLLPDEYRTRGDTQIDARHESDRRRFKDTIGLLLPVYKARAGTLVHEESLAQAEEVISEDLKASPFGETYPTRTAFLFEPWGFTALDILLRGSSDATVLIERIAEAAERIIGRNTSHFWSQISAHLFREQRYHAVAFHLIERAANYLMDQAVPAAERWQSLLQCASIVAPCEIDLCRDYYKRALEAAEGIDDDLIPLFILYCRMSKLLPEQKQVRSSGLESHVSSKLTRTTFRSHRISCEKRPLRPSLT
jgi:hypothetical protein